MFDRFMSEDIPLPEQDTISRTGIVPRIEINQSIEPQMPPAELPETLQEVVATTGVMRAVGESRDPEAEDQDRDASTGKTAS